MSTIRKDTNPKEIDLSPELRDVLRRNGMQAHIDIAQDGGFQLTVLGHDSPVLTYKLNDRQVDELMGWGSTFMNRRAYNAFTSIVRNDFHMPDNFVSASNAFGRVAVGLHGYRIGAGEYGYRGHRVPWYAPLTRLGRGWGGDFVNWAPRHEGFHLRRIGGHAYEPYGGPVVAERPDGRIKPGEARSGGYGFYYKGQQREVSSDMLTHVVENSKYQLPAAAKRPEPGKALPLSEETGKHLYFGDAFQASLKSHGIVIDPKKNTLEIQSSGTKLDYWYDIKPEQVQKLTALQEKGKSGVSLDERIALINDIIKSDYATPLTKEMLESREIVDIELKPEIRAQHESAFIAEEHRQAEMEIIQKEQEKRLQENDRIRKDPNAINGREIQTVLGNRGWFQPVENGRQMYVGEIRVDKNVEDRSEIRGRILEIQGKTALLSQQLKALEKPLSPEVQQNVAALQLEQRDVLKKWIDGSQERADLKKDIAILERDIESHKASDIPNKSNIIANEEQLLSQYKQRLADYDSLKSEVDRIGKKIEAAGGLQVSVAEKQYDIIMERNKLNAELRELQSFQKTPLKIDYVMSAVINGRMVEHTISQQDYEKFLELDDKHRLQMFDKLFGEVQIKSAHGETLYNDDMYISQDGKHVAHDEDLGIEHSRSNSVDGAALKELNSRKGFYHERAGGREVEVGDIRVEPQQEGKYKMTAVINGTPISHEISQKQYDKFMAVDDYHRLQLFSKIFNEVDIKTRPGQGTNIGAAILAAIVATGEVLAEGLDIARGPHGPRPEIYESHTLYNKPGVVSPADVAAANFRSQEEALGGHEESMGRGI